MPDMQSVVKHEEILRSGMGFKFKNSLFTLSEKKGKNSLFHYQLNLIRQKQVEKQVLPGLRTIQ